MTKTNAPSTPEHFQAAPWFILGGGAMGCLWAYDLAPNSIILAKPERYLQYTNGSSTALITTKLSYRQASQNVPFICECRLANIQNYSSPILKLIVTTKAQDTLSALSAVQHTLHPQAHILLLQNGMGSQQAVKEQFPIHTLWCGSTTQGAYTTDFLHVVHAGFGQTAIGPWHTTSETNPHFSAIFQQQLIAQGQQVTFIKDIQPLLWQKLAVNACINGLTVLFTCKNGELLTCPNRLKWVEKLCQETEQLLDNKHIALTKPLFQHVCHVLKQTAENYSSTYMDVTHQRPTELMYINGFILSEAKQLGLLLPSHTALMEQLAQKGIF
ncbi:ketopantoate reductase family protein [Zooshikella harenae]|uniref:2-dehydropantoate 2-reductase n=1 Tax=Zooshikella harenae TaxID=2827238 RepID=A0ABS5ZCZ5_9GAMM|nr:2-dehydropantoate 2-reductase [Zooshikella harenae]MBU2711733.1 2-dehydropantoate 2-reductase [Zooshikella harenae]